MGWASTLLAGWLLLVGMGWAAAQVAIPPLSGRVVDATGTMSNAQRMQLERMSADYEKQKGTQVVVALIPSTGGEPIEQYALRMSEKWQVGRRGVDDGVLFLIAKQDRAMRIEVGYGLEGALTDVQSKRIIDDVVAPYFRRNDYFGGINAGMERIFASIEGENLPAPVWGGENSPAPELGGWTAILPILFPIVLVGVFLLRLLLGRLAGGVVTGGIVGVLTWLFAGSLIAGLLLAFFAFLFVLGGGFSGGRRGRSAWRSVGGFGGGGMGRSGGFGGFSGGGGRFGGGGASGRW